MTPASTIPPLLAANGASSPGLTQVIAPYMSIFFIAFFAAFVLTPLMRVAAVRNGIIDWPDLQRKGHIQPVAYLGGVAIFLAWLAGVAAAYWTAPHPEAADGAADYVRFPISIVIGAALVMFTGLFDDLYGISPRVKVGGQFLAAAALASQHLGLELTTTALDLLYLPTPYWLVWPLGTVALGVFVVGGCNAFNLLDGLDGLAAGVTAIGCAGLLVMAALVAQGGYDPADAAVYDPVRLTMCLAILGAVLGFLPFNFNPATIFMGDAGSLLLGFLATAAILLFGEVEGGGPRLVTAALIIFALPITDTALTIFRRCMTRQPIFRPDSEHLHHMLRRGGLSVRQSVLVMYAAAVGFAALGCTLVALELRWRYVLAVFVVLFGFVLASGYKYGQRQRALADLANDLEAEGTTPEDLSAMPPGERTRDDEVEV